MVTNPVSGAWYFFKGVTLLGKPGIRSYVIIPLLINILVFTAAIALGIGFLEPFIDQMMENLPDWLQWLSWVFKVLFFLMAFLIMFFTFSLVGNIISAPFNGLLSEAVELYLAGKKPEQAGGWKKVGREFLSSMGGEVKKFGYFIAWSIPLWILSFIPGVNVIAPFAWMIFGAWMLSIEYMDFPMSNRGLIFPSNKNKLSEKRLLSLGFGGAAMAITMIPVGNFLVIPAAVAGATAMWLEKFEDNREMDQTT